LHSGETFASADILFIVLSSLTAGNAILVVPETLLSGSVIIFKKKKERKKVSGGSGCGNFPVRINVQEGKSEWGGGGVGWGGSGYGNFAVQIPDHLKKEKRKKVSERGYEKLVMVVETVSGLVLTLAH